MILIFRFVDTVREIFAVQIVSQFLISSVILSVNIFQLSTTKSIDLQFFTKLLHFACMLVEFFNYCWFGNQITLEVSYM